MPLVRVRKNGKIVGSQWGKSGKVYKTKKDALRQGRAIKAKKSY